MKEREKKRYLTHDKFNFMSKHSKVKLTKIFDIFSGVNVKVGLKQHATNTEMSPPTISINNVITMKMPLKIANIYYLIPPLLYLYLLIFQALNKGIRLRRLNSSYKSTPSDDNNNNNVPATISLYA